MPPAVTDAVFRGGLSSAAGQTDSARPAEGFISGLSGDTPAEGLGITRQDLFRDWVLE